MTTSSNFSKQEMPTEPMIFSLFFEIFSFAAEQGTGLYTIMPTPKKSSNTI